MRFLQSGPRKDLARMRDALREQRIRAEVRPNGTGSWKLVVPAEQHEQALQLMSEVTCSD